MSRIWKTPLLGVCVALSLAACEKNASDAAPAPAEKAPAAPVAKAPAAPAKAPEAPADKPAAAPAEKNFQVRVVPGEATAGQPHQTVVEVTPAAGYHMNLEFPSKMRLTKKDKVTAAKDELSGDDVAVTEEALKFTVAFTPNEAGNLDLAGSCDFSVCNENACKLVRGEEVAWAVTVK